MPKTPVYWFLLLTIVVFTNQAVLAQPVSKTMLRLPDTGQSASYTNTPGEDSDYNINPPFFRLNGNGTVTDTVTGLMWQQTDGGEMTYENALIYCDTLTLGGYTNWRLPAPHESFSILNHSRPNPALDPAAFTATGAEYWWTAAPQVNDATRIWVTNAGGGIGNHLKSETVSAGGTKKIHVRAVRDRQAPQVLPAQFTNNGDGTVTDHLTGLVWQQVPLADTLTWEQALVYAENLMLAGKDDWRLPNIKELQSLSDEHFVNPSVNTAFFSTVGVTKYWSSTSLPNQTTKAWYLDTRFGITTYDFKTRSFNLICVRGNLPVAVATKEPAYDETPRVLAYPNPFSATLHLTANSGSVDCRLSDCMGRLVYAGREIEKQDFSALQPGIYFLQILGESSTVLKLVK